MQTEKQPLNHARYMYTILIAILAIIFCLTLKNCLGLVHSLQQPKQEIKQSDTVIKFIYQKKWVPLVVNVHTPKDSIPYPVPSHIGTLAILQKFFTEYTYRDTIQDTNLIALSTIHIAENKIKSHALSYKWLQPQKETIITNTVEKPSKPVLLIGLNLNLTKNTMLGGGPELLFISKRQRVMGAGYDPFHQTYSIKAYLPIRFKK